MFLYQPKIGDIFGPWRVIDTLVYRQKKADRKGRYREGFRCSCANCGTERIMLFETLVKCRNRGATACRKCHIVFNKLHIDGGRASSKKHDTDRRRLAEKGLKRCATCKETRRQTEFHKSSKTWDGRGTQCRRCYKSTCLMNAFGVTIEDYESLLDTQHSRCDICGKHVEDEGRSFAVDHCHKTGKVRGLLCGSCNNGLGFFYDDCSLLQRAIGYITKHRKDPSTLQDRVARGG